MPETEPQKQPKQGDQTDKKDDFKLNLPIVNLSSNQIHQKGQPGVVYLGRIPHGFYEEEMKSYFSQFGTVNRLRLSRNKKTGASKHYAFIEFESQSVAQVVVETMHNYLLSNRLLQCRLMNADEIHPQIFKGAGEKFKALPWNKIARVRHNREKSAEEKVEHLEKVQKNEEKKRKKLKELGIEYDFPGHFKRPKGEELVAATVETSAQESTANSKSKVTELSETETVESKAKPSKATGAKRTSSRTNIVATESPVAADEDENTIVEKPKPSKKLLGKKTTKKSIK